MEDGRALTALEMQAEFLQWAKRYFQSTPPSAAEAAILVEWERTLGALRRDPEELTGKLDWVTKRGLLRGVGDACGWEIGSPQATVADILYHALDPAESLYFPLEQLSLITFPPGWDSSRPERYLTDPPDDSRAWLRGRCISRFGGAIRDIDWSEIGFKKFRIQMLDPLALCREAAEPLFDRSPDVASFLESIKSLPESTLEENALK